VLPPPANGKKYQIHYHQICVFLITVRQNPFGLGFGRWVWQCRWILGRQMDWGGRWVGDDIKIEIFYIPVSSKM